MSAASMSLKSHYNGKSHKDSLGFETILHFIYRSWTHYPVFRTACAFTGVLETQAKKAAKVAH